MRGFEGVGIATWAPISLWPECLGLKFELTSFYALNLLQICDLPFVLEALRREVGASHYLLAR
jgi:hypothetical protein